MDMIFKVENEIAIIVSLLDFTSTIQAQL